MGDIDYRKKVMDFMKKNIKLEDDSLKKIEKNVFNFSIDYAIKNNIPRTWKSVHFVDIYERKALSVFKNIQDLANNDMERLLGMNMEDIPYMSPEQLNPELWKDLLDRHKNKVKNSYEMHMLPMSDRIVCRKCKGREIAYYEFQSRKADEGSSTAYTCLSCNYKWKKN